MSRSIISMWCLVGAVSLAGPLIAWRTCASACADATQQSRRFELVDAKVTELKRLRVESPPPALGPRDEGGLAPRLTQTLAAAGVPATSLSSLTPQNETIRTADGKQALRRRAAVTLAPIRLPELGVFLDAWRKQNPEAVVSSIELSPEPSTTAPPGGDIPLRVVMTIESAAVEEQGGAP